MQIHRLFCCLFVIPKVSDKTMSLRAQRGNRMLYRATMPIAERLIAAGAITFSLLFNSTQDHVFSSEAHLLTERGGSKMAGKEGSSRFCYAPNFNTN